MKRLHIAVFCGLFSVAFFSGCKKDEKPTAKECQVEQFESTRFFYYNKVYQQIPYLFKKTFDVNGRVSNIDAFIYPSGEGVRIQSKLEYKNQMVYLLDQMSTDTIMVLWLNSAGRVIQAEEKSGFRYAGSQPVMSYQFTYSGDNKLQQYIAQNKSYPAFPQTSTTPIEYDANGNCTRSSGSYFTYDLTRTAKKQFYYDSEYFTTYWLGVKLLEYLNYFPELTSPPNIRIFTRAGSDDMYVFARTALTDHQFDTDGKLISYKAGTQTIPVFWNCGVTSPKQ